MNEEEKYEKIEWLEEASKKIYEAIQLIKDAVEDTSEKRRANSYIIPHLKSWVEDSNQISNIPELIREIEEEENLVECAECGEEFEEDELNEEELCSECAEELETEVERKGHPVTGKNNSKEAEKVLFELAKENKKGGE